jgi:hypothetical protein
VDEQTAPDQAVILEHTTKKQAELSAIKKYLTSADISSGELMMSDPSFPRTEDDFKLKYVYTDMDNSRRLSLRRIQQSLP